MNEWMNEWINAWIFLNVCPTGLWAKRRVLFTWNRQSAKPTQTQKRQEFSNSNYKSVDSDWPVGWLMDWSVSTHQFRKFRTAIYIHRVVNVTRHISNFPFFDTCQHLIQLTLYTDQDGAVVKSWNPVWKMPSSNLSRVNKDTDRGFSSLLPVSRSMLRHYLNKFTTVSFQILLIYFLSRSNIDIMSQYSVVKI
jgi:hypothetical protein